MKTILTARQITVWVKDFGPICMSEDRGKKLFRAIVEHFMDGSVITLDFKGVERMTGAFLNAGIGQLYGLYTEAFIRDHMKPPKNIAPLQLQLLDLVTRNAKTHFAQQRAQSGDASV